MKRAVERFGLGVDLEEFKRFEPIDPGSRPRFYERVFMDSEKNFCLKGARPHRLFCGLFAAKEAVIKAVNGTIGDIGDIEIVCTQRSKPQVRLHGRLSELPVALSLGISYRKDAALAVCVASPAAA